MLSGFKNIRIELGGLRKRAALGESKRVAYLGFNGRLNFAPPLRVKAITELLNRIGFDPRFGLFAAAVSELEIVVRSDVLLQSVG